MNITVTARKQSANPNLAKDCFPRNGLLTARKENRDAQPHRCR
jgi:hypothetical protein